MKAPVRKVRVLIVDDSALVRRILSTGLQRDPGITVIGEASDPYKARDLIVQLRPDVITLDVEMPRMDGITFLKHLMPVLPTPVIIISSLTQHGAKLTTEALMSGAVDVIAKPQMGLVDSMPQMLDDICRRVKAAAGLNMEKFRRQAGAIVTELATDLGETTDRVIAIGASTGGVEALSRIIPAFPANAPGIVIVQHMPAGVTSTFAARLNGLSRMQVKEAEDNDRILPGRVLLAPGGPLHMKVVRSGGQYRVKLEAGPEVHYSRPAVDVLFKSVAEEVRGNAAAALLTGMGRDGAEGLLAIRQAGGKTLAQDEATCVVYGMPQMACRLGAAEMQAPLEKIPLLLVQALNAA